MPEHEGSNRTVTFLPWFKISDLVEIGDLVFWRYPAHKPQFVPNANFETQLQRMFSSYVDIQGVAVTELTIASFRSEPFRGLSPDEAGGIRDLIRLLAFSVISENDYYRQIGQYFNSTHFQHFHQRFQLGSIWIAPEARRREGRTIHGGHQHGQVKFTMPIQCATGLGGRPNLPLLQGLETVLRQATPEAAAIRQAIDWFFLASSDSDSVSLRTETVMMASAFEALLQVQDEKGKKEALKQELRGLFASFFIEEVEREGTDGKRERRSWKVWWMDEFYWLRNKIVHGQKIEPKRMTWTFHEHLTIAAIVLTTAVKLKLAQLGRYTLSPDDQTAADSIDPFVADGNLSEDKLLGARRKVRWR